MSDPSTQMRCRKCGVDLVERPLAGQTYEQKWVATWFDHPPVPLGGCTGETVLIPSPELLKQESEMRAEHARQLEIGTDDDR